MTVRLHKGGNEIRPHICNTIRATHRRRNAPIGEHIYIATSKVPALNSGENLRGVFNKSPG